MKSSVSLVVIAATLALLGSSAQAQTTISEAWVRGTVPQQQATGAFMRITSAQGGKLVGVATPVASISEIHEMKMEAGVMKMAAVPALDLPAGKVVELKPGGYHLMFMGLKQALKAGDTVPVTLTVEGKDGKKESLDLKLEVRALGASPAASGPGHMKH
jgi:periplasmic copper chaperone A